MQNTCLLILLLFLGLSCSTAPEFERDNENDPVSSDFIPDISNLSVSINPDKTVSLNWNDDSKYESGFIISKSFDLDSNFVILDTIPSNFTSYVDSSKSIDTNTYYKISAFSKSVNENSSFGIIQALDFGSIQQLQTNTFGNKISLNWNNDRLYADRFLVEKKQPESEIWEVVQAIAGNSTSYSFQDLNESYLIDVRISAQILSSSSEFKNIDTFQDTMVNYNLPSNLQVKITSEATVDLIWEDNSEFDDYFVILQREARNKSDPGNGEYIPIDTVQGISSNTFLKYSDYFHYEFSIQPLYKNTLGNPNGFVIKTLITNPPTIIKINSISDREVEILWQDNNRNIPEDNYFETYSFHIDILHENGTFQVIDHIDPNEDSYILSNLDSSKNYKIRMRSYSSRYSNFKTIENLPSIQKNFENNISNLESFDFDEKTNSVLIIKSEVPRRIQVFDIDSRTFESFDIRNGEALQLKASKKNESVAINHFFDAKDSSLVFVYDVSNNGIIIDSLIYSSNNKMKILEFESHSSLIISEFNSQERKGIVLKWNIETEVIDTLYKYDCFCSSNDMASAILYDSTTLQYLLGVDRSILILNSDGNKIDEIYLGGTPFLLKRSLDRIYYKLHDTIIGFYDLVNKKSNTIYQGYNVSGFIELSSLNYFIVSDYSSSTPFLTYFNFFDSYSLDYKFQLKSENQTYGLLYFENNNRIVGVSNLAIEEFDIITKWEIIN